MPTQRLIRTDAGRAEIRQRALPLSRVARNLLIVVEPEHDIAHWLAQVHGARLADLHELVSHGLLVPVDPPAAPGSSSGGARRSRSELPRIPLQQALDRLSFGTLYDRLTAEARPRLGLIAGYRAILAIERAGDLPALREVALQFVEQVRQARGDDEAQRVAQILADGRPAR